jgi:hypothetical protein
MRWLLDHLIESFIVLAIVGILVAVGLGVWWESKQPPCLKYETRTIMVYNPQLKTTLPQTSKVCVERAAEQP